MALIVPDRIKRAEIRRYARALRVVFEDAPTVVIGVHCAENGRVARPRTVSGNAVAAVIHECGGPRRRILGVRTGGGRRIEGDLVAVEIIRAPAGVVAPLDLGLLHVVHLGNPERLPFVPPAAIGGAGAPGHSCRGLNRIPARPGKTCRAGKGGVERRQTGVLGLPRV